MTDKYFIDFARPSKCWF